MTDRQRGDVVIDTSSVRAEERFDFFADATSRVFYPMTCEHDSARTFWGRVWGSQIGFMRVFRIQAAPMTVTRTTSAIARYDPEHFSLTLQTRGRCCATQGDRTAVSEGGDITAYDSSAPYRLAGETPFELLVFWIPKALIPASVPRMQRLTATRFRGDVGVGRLIVPFCREVVRSLSNGSLGPDDTVVSESLVALVDGLYREPRDGSGRAGGRSSTELVIEVKAYIDAHLGDQRLAAGDIASANYISTRYLHKLFAAEGATVGEWVRRRRLERCRRELADPVRIHDPVFAIAGRAGLTSGQLARLFRAYYGCSPREFRHDALRRSLDDGIRST